MRQFTDAIIPDALLEEYLKDKLTTKPDYGYSTEAGASLSGKEVAAREAEYKAKMASNKQGNPKR
jgi:hypothetical protein